MVTMLSAPEMLSAPARTEPAPGGAVASGMATSRLTEEELAGVVAFACARFPQCPLGEVSAVVTEAYRHLAERATITAHLIPLTVNRRLRILRRSTAPIDTRVACH